MAFPFCHGPSRKRHGASTTVFDDQYAERFPTLQLGKTARFRESKTVRGIGNDQEPNVRER